MKMNLIERVNKKLEKYNLIFTNYKEYSEKYKGVLRDTETGYEKTYEVWKCLQTEYIGSFAKQCREHIDLCVKYDQMMKGEK